MISSKRNVERMFKTIDNSLFMITGNLEYDRITTAIELLANMVHEYKDDTQEIWYIGEFGNCTLDDLIVGAYWHYSDWHGGQYSDTYRALCALGSVFSPGISSMDEDNNPAYEALNNMAEDSKQCQ